MLLSLFCKQESNALISVENFPYPSRERKVILAATDERKKLVMKTTFLNISKRLPFYFDTKETSGKKLIRKWYVRENNIDKQN